MKVKYRVFILELQSNRLTFTTALLILATQRFCTVSDCSQYGLAAIWAHLQPVIDYLRMMKTVSGIHFVSDGPTTQYCNKMNFYPWKKKIFDSGFKCSPWSCLEASHGKGAADVVGAAVKRAADKYVNMRNGDITCGKDVVDSVAKNSNVKMLYIEENTISHLQKTLSTTLQPVPDKIHQVC